MANKGKGDLNYNFEILKEQMKKKRELAESMSKNNDSNEEMINQILEELNENKNIENKFVLEESIEPENVLQNRTIQEEKSKVEEHNVVSKIIIKKVVKPEAPKRITYYLKPETIKKIDKFSKMAGMGKSEFVQKILEEALNNLEIEK